MIWIPVIVCLLLAGAAAVWFSPLRGRLLDVFSAARDYLSRAVSVFDRFRFSCFVEQFTDETQPARQDQFFRVQIAGRIPTEQEQTDTVVQIEILDVTGGASDVQPVLSADENYREAEKAEFYLIRHNGVVPDKNAVLAHRVTVAQFPCHILRFACRGRRKLQFRATVMEAASGKKLATARKIFEYVYCSDGYREVHGRRLEVMRACVELSAIVLGPAGCSEDIKGRWVEWIQEKAEMFIPVDEAVETVEAVGNRTETLTMQHSSDIILAYGKNTDRFCAIELALQAAAFGGVVSRDNLEKLSQAAQLLDIQRDRFLSMAQKLLLSLSCQIEDPSQLLGITPGMNEDDFRKRLNEEYRKWNARVTHPDAQIRTRADRILTLIAEIRSQRLQPNG